MKKTLYSWFFGFAIFGLLVGLLCVISAFVPGDEQWGKVGFWLMGISCLGGIFSLQKLREVT